ncbi:MAG: hypothetical protein GY823_04075 [Flavobacteriaceae bacterium]|nr:hypothetical protein [Flavobacteriaceae bacterium]
MKTSKQEIVESLQKGNQSWVMQQIKKMSRYEEADFVEYLYTDCGMPDTAIFIACRIINNDYR